MRRNFTWLLVAIIVIVVAFVRVVAVGQFNESVVSELEKSARSRVSEIAIQQQLSLNREFDIERTILENIADTAVLLEEDKAEVVAYLQVVVADFSLQEIGVAGVSGRAVLSSGEVVDLSERDYFDDVISGGSITTKPYESPQTGLSVFAMASPMYLNNEVVGMVEAVYSLDFIDSMLNLSVINEGAAAIITGDGEILVATDKGFLQEDISIVDQFNNSKVTDSILADLYNGFVGTQEIELDNVKYLMEYRPLSVNDWTLLYMVSQSEVMGSTAVIEKSIENVALAAIVATTLLVIYIFLLRKNNSAELEKKAYYDELTGLANMAKFKKDVYEILKKNPQQKLMAVKMDIMNFKAINEMYGHEMGDEVLLAIASTAQHVTIKPFIFARAGADEFFVFGKHDFLININEIIDSYEEIFLGGVSDAKKHEFIFRYGRYAIEQGETDVTDIINKASLAHSHAKKLEGERVFDYTEKIKNTMIMQTEITNKMHDAIENREFKVYLQPKISVDSNELKGAEALVRWIESDGKMIFPNDFIPIFEGNGFIVELDKYMLDSTCKIINDWKQKGYKLVPVSVNFSRVNLENANFVEDIKQICDNNNVERKYIEVELTETALTESEEALGKLLKDLFDAGFSVSIDDFGAGYSSLGMLKSFKVDTLKLDRSFFIDHEDDVRGNTVVKGIIEIAHNLGMDTVAEGIESLEQIEFLSKVGCESAQGYVFSKPIDPSAFEEKYLKQE